MVTIGVGKLAKKHTSRETTSKQTHIEPVRSYRGSDANKRIPRIRKGIAKTANKRRSEKKKIKKDRHMVKMNKKGNALKIIFVVIIFIFMIFVLTISNITWNFMMTKTADKLVEQTSLIQNSSAASVNVTAILDMTVVEGKESMDMLRWVTFVIVVVFFIAVLILSYFVRSNPWWMGAYVIGLVFMIIVANAVGDTYEELATNPAMAEAIAGWGAMNIFFVYIERWILMLGILSAIIMIMQMGKKTEKLGGFA